MPEGLRFRRGVAGDRAALAALQADAYAPNAAIIGGVPTPVTWDFASVLEDWEVWLVEDEVGLAGALLLEKREDGFLIQSVAVAARAKGHGLGNRLLAWAEVRAIEEEVDLLRLVANARMVFNVDWYGRKGFVVERIEQIGARQRVHMTKAVRQPRP